MSSVMSNEEKKRLAYERQIAVRNAWKEEKARVEAGCGTRNWSKAEQEELLQRGAVSGYEGHHMKSVSIYPEYAGDSRNIQFLSEDEHLYGAHQGSYHQATNGYYNPVTSEMIEFEGDELRELPIIELDYSQSDFSSNEIEIARGSYCLDNKAQAHNEISDYQELAAAKAVYDTNYYADDSMISSETNSESSGINNGISR